MRIIECIVGIIGCLTISFISALLVVNLRIKITEVMKRQSKIRCLCKHEYVFVMSCWCDGVFTEYQYKCRKCGKVLEIKVMEKGGEQT